MAITASTISSTQTLEEFRLEFNILQSDVSTLESNPTYGTSITFEGATTDAYETTLTVTDPTADRTITLPNATGTVLLSGTAFDIDDLDIDGGTDIGAAIVDADLFIIDDGAGGTNRKVTASRLKTYAASTYDGDIDDLDIDGGTDIGAAVVAADLFIVDDGAGGTNRKTAASRIKTFIEASTVAVTGNVTATGTVEPAGDTAASDNAAIGYTSAEGLILTGQGSTSDVTIKNDADADVITIATGTTNVDVVGDLTAGTLNADGDTAAGDNAAIGYTAAEGLILAGQGSTNDVTIKNDADADVITIATGTTNVDVVGDLTAGTLNADGDTAASDNAAIGYTSAEGLILTGQGSTNDITIKRDDDTAVLEVATGQSDIEVSGGNIIFGTASKGVYLGVTSATAANLLDDYEEGTWTPSFISTSATFAYAQQVGSYTKVGNLVHCEFRLALSGSPGGTTTNGTIISGQPFTAATVSNLYYAFHIGHFFNINLDANEQAGIAGQVGSQGTTIELKGMGDNVGEQGIQAASMGSAAEIRGSFSYRTA